MTDVDPGSVAGFAAALGDPTRMAMCLALLDGRAWTAGELARQVDVAASTASEQLTHLVAAGVCAEERQGRHRYVRLADDEVARLIEDMTARAGRPGQPPRSLRAVRVTADLAFARTCYDHLAGRLGVGVLDSMIGRELVVDLDEVTVTQRGRAWLTRLGGTLAKPAGSRRPLARTCIDWTERRPHLAGSAGAALLAVMVERDWVRRRHGARTLVVTDLGRQRLRAELDLDVTTL